MKDPTVIVCSPRTESAVPGSVVRVCSRCRQDVWLSISGQKLVARKPNMKIQCTPCAMPTLASGMVPVDAVEGAYNEIREHAGLSTEISARLFTAAMQEKHRRRSN